MWFPMSGQHVSKQLLKYFGWVFTHFSNVINREVCVRSQSTHGLTEFLSINDVLMSILCKSCSLPSFLSKFSHVQLELQPNWIIHLYFSSQTFTSAPPLYHSLSFSQGHVLESFGGHTDRHQQVSWYLRANISDRSDTRAIFYRKPWDNQEVCEGKHLVPS